VPASGKIPVPDRSVLVLGRWRERGALDGRSTLSSTYRSRCGGLRPGGHRPARRLSPRAGRHRALQRAAAGRDAGFQHGYDVVTGPGSTRSWRAGRLAPGRRAARGRPRAGPGHRAQHLGVGVGGEPGLVGRAADGSASPYAELVRHRLFPAPGRPVGDPGARRRTDRAGRAEAGRRRATGLRAALLRAPLPGASGTHEGTPQQVHDRQNYRLVCWRLADTELNYRRFFAVSSWPACGRGPGGVPGHARRDPALGRLRSAGRASGGSPGRAARPGRYLARLAAPRRVSGCGREDPEAAGDDAAPRSCPSGGDGTTGYDSLREVCGSSSIPVPPMPFRAPDPGPAAGTAGNWTPRPGCWPPR